MTTEMAVRPKTHKLFVFLRKQKKRWIFLTMNASNIQFHPCPKRIKHVRKYVCSLTLFCSPNALEYCPASCAPYETLHLMGRQRCLHQNLLLPHVYPHRPHSCTQNKGEVRKRARGTEKKERKKEKGEEPKQGERKAMRRTHRDEE